MKIPVVKNVLDANNRIAAENQALFAAHQVYTINLISSPGAGKTTLIEKTIAALRTDYRIGVIEGDIQDTCDAERIAKLGVPVVQITTGGACHIDSSMVREALATFDLAALDFLIIENVGNLVCPAEFSLGEHAKVAMLSVPEGDDKPAKYPLIFHVSSVLLINKIDLMPYVSFDRERACSDARKNNPQLLLFEISCKTNAGMDGWYAWLRTQIASIRQ
ncbi:MAG: hydrogenase nickel incorporation protein HypB [Desulfobacterota bacterium]|nr:hydrogenase nickel incorporation protein HypB [Thermodesulfobacteriota bacterium]